MVPDRDMAKNPTMGTVPRTTSPTWGYENLIYLGPNTWIHGKIAIKVRKAKSCPWKLCKQYLQNKNFKHSSKVYFILTF